MPRVKMAKRSLTVSIGHGPNSDIESPDLRDFLGNAGNTPLTSASSRLDLNINQDRNDATRDEEDVDDGEFPALRPNYDRKAHTHHNVIII